MRTNDYDGILTFDAVDRSAIEKEKIQRMEWMKKKVRVLDFLVNMWQAKTI